MNKETHIYFDANVLLDLYSYSEDTINSIIKGFSQIEKFCDLIIPKRAYEEYQRHYRACRKIKGGRNNIETFAKKFQDCFEVIERKIDSLPNIHEQYECKIGALISNEKSSLSTFKNAVGAEIDQLRKTLQPNLDDSNDPVFDFVEKHKPLNLMTIKEKIAVSVWGEQRIKMGLKPGQTDYKDKEQFDKYGDIFIWKEVLDSPQNLIRCYFLTDELKNDWWKERDSSEFEPQLVQEYQDEHPNTEFIALRFPDYCRRESSSFDANALAEISSLRVSLEKLLNDSNKIIELISDNVWGYDFRKIEDSLLLEVARGGNIERVDNFDAYEICENSGKIIDVSLNEYEETVDIKCELAFEGCADVMTRYYADAYDYLSIKFVARVKIEAMLSLNYYPDLDFVFEDIFDVSPIETRITEEKDFVPDPYDYL